MAVAADPAGFAGGNAAARAARMRASLRSNFASGVSGLCPAGVGQHSWKVLAHLES
jgi:hypothetical protein